MYFFYTSLENPSNDSDISIKSAGSKGVDDCSDSAPEYEGKDENITMIKRKQLKRMFKMIEFFREQSPKKPISQAKFDNFVNHKLRLRDSPAKIKAMVNRLIAKIRTLIMEMGALKRDEDISAILHLESVLIHVSTSPWLNKTWWNFLWKNIYTKINGNVLKLRQNGNVPKDRSNYVTDAMCDAEWNRCHYQWTKGLPYIRYLAESKDDPNYDFGECVISPFWQACQTEIAMAGYAQNLCSHTSRKTTELDPKVKNKKKIKYYYYKRAFKLSDKMTDWLDKAYSNENGLLYILFFDWRDRGARSKNQQQSNNTERKPLMKQNQKKRSKRLNKNKNETSSEEDYEQDNDINDDHAVTTGHKFGIDDVPLFPGLNDKLKNGINTDMDILIPLRMMVQEPYAQRAYIEHMAMMQQKQMAFFPTQQQNAQGSWHWDIHCLHVAMQDIEQTVANVTYMHYLHASRSLSEGVLCFDAKQMGNKINNQEMNSLDINTEAETRELSTDVSYLNDCDDADLFDMNWWKGHQVRQMLWTGIANDDIKDDTIMEPIMSGTYEHNIWLKPLSTALVMISNSSLRGKNGKLTHVKYRGIPDEYIKDWEKNMIQYNMGLCNAYVAELRTLDWRETVIGFQCMHNKWYQVSDMVVNNLIEQHMTKLSKNYMNTKFWKYTQYNPARQWTREQERTMAKYSLVCCNKYYGDDWRWISMKQRTFIRSIAFKIGVKQMKHWPNLTCVDKGKKMKDNKWDTVDTQSDHEPITSDIENANVKQNNVIAGWENTELFEPGNQSASNLVLQQEQQLLDLWKNSKSNNNSNNNTNSNTNTNSNDNINSKFKQTKNQEWLVPAARVQQRASKSKKKQSQPVVNMNDSCVNRRSKNAAKLDAHFRSKNKSRSKYAGKSKWNDNDYDGDIDLFNTSYKQPPPKSKQRTRW